MVKIRLRNVLSLGLTVVLACGILGGCSKSPSDKMEVETPNIEGDVEVGASKNPEDYTGTLTMWGWDDTYFETVTEAFKIKYPNVDFEYTPVANGDLLQKYQTALATDTELPDVAWAIIDSRAKVFELDMWEALDKEPYNLEINDVMDYLHPIMKNSKGDVCGIEQSISAAGLAYRKDLAKEYFGTDDPGELAKLFPTWEAFIEKGIEVKEKSNGEIFMWPGMGDAQQFIREQDPSPWIEGDTIHITKTLQRTIELAVAFRDAGIVDKLEAWTPAWYAAYGEGKHIFAGCATWVPPFVIHPNDEAGQEAGHWGLMNVPEGNISWGGTTLGISKTSKNKELAWEFIKFATLSQEGAEALKEIGFLTSAKAPYENDPEFASHKDEWFGGQDTGKFFVEEIVPNIELRPMAVDSNVIHDSLNLITTSLNNDHNMTAEMAMEKLIEEVKMNLPDYKVE